MAAIVEADQRAAMRAAVLEGAEFAVFGARDDDRHGTDEGGAVVADVGEFIFQAEEAPDRALEQALLLQGEHVGVCVYPIRDAGKAGQARSGLVRSVHGSSLPSLPTPLRLRPSTFSGALGKDRQGALPLRVNTPQPYPAYAGELQDSLSRESGGGLGRGCRDVSSTAGPARAPQPEHRPKSHQPQAAQPSTALIVAPDVITSSTSSTRFPVTRTARGALHHERIRHFHRPFRRRLVTQRPCRPPPHQRIQHARPPRDPPHRVRQQCRLIIPPMEQPRPVQRHRHQHIHLPQQRGASPCHMRCQYPSKLLPIGVLQRQDQPPPLHVIPQRGARAPKHRRRFPASGVQTASAPPKSRRGKRHPAAQRRTAR